MLKNCLTFSRGNNLLIHRFFRYLCGELSTGDFSPIMEYVYLIGDSEREGAYKIGMTKQKMEKRLKALQTGNASNLEVCYIHETEDAYTLEAMLHRKYQSKRIKNEWFELSDEEVRGFKSVCENLENVIKSLSGNPFFRKRKTSSRFR